MRDVEGLVAVKDAALERLERGAVQVAVDEAQRLEALEARRHEPPRALEADARARDQEEAQAWHPAKRARGVERGEGQAAVAPKAAV
jgi:hypothetical protein